MNKQLKLIVSLALLATANTMPSLLALRDQTDIRSTDQHAAAVAFIETELHRNGIDPTTIAIRNGNDFCVRRGLRYFPKSILEIPLEQMEQDLRENNSEKIDGHRFSIAHESGHLQEKLLKKLALFVPTMVAVSEGIIHCVPKKFAQRFSQMARDFATIGTCLLVCGLYITLQRCVDERLADNFAINTFRDNPDVLKAAAAHYIENSPDEICFESVYPFQPTTLRRLKWLYLDTIPHGQDLVRMAKLLTAAGLPTTKNDLGRFFLGYAIFRNDHYDLLANLRKITNKTTNFVPLLGELDTLMAALSPENKLYALHNLREIIARIRNLQDLTSELQTARQSTLDLFARVFADVDNGKPESMSPLTQYIYSAELVKKHIGQLRKMEQTVATVSPANKATVYRGYRKLVEEYRKDLCTQPTIPMYAQEHAAIRRAVNAFDKTFAGFVDDEPPATPENLATTNSAAGPAAPAGQS